MSNIVIKARDEAARVVESKPYDLEALLRDNISKLPELIPLEEAAEGPVRLLTIGKEVAVESGAIDLLLLGSDGLLTIVETKLGRNPGSRREVIGQVLAYAACASDWGIDDIALIATKHWGRPFDTTLSDFLGEDGDAPTSADFLTLVDENLRAGRLRLVIAADVLLEAVRKTITFVNRNSYFDIFLLHITCYEDSTGTRIYVPVLHGYSPKAKQPRSRSLWEPKDADEALLSRLEEIAESEGWEVERRQTRHSIDLPSADGSWHWVFGIEYKKTRGTNYYFYSLDHELPIELPDGIEHRFTSEYLYLWGSLETLSKKQLLALCVSALANAESGEIGD